MSRSSDYVNQLAEIYKDIIEFLEDIQSEYEENKE